MIVQKDFLNKVKQFGVNSYEAKIWTALLSRGISTAGELSDISNVPRSRSYDVLESLEKKGFIVMKIGKPIKYIAVKPEEVIERVKRRVREDADTSIQSLDNIKASEVLQELNVLHKKGVELVEPTDLSGSLRGRANIYNQLESMVKSAEESIIIMTTTEGLKRKTDNLKHVFHKAAKRGVKIKIAAPLTDAASKQAAKELSNIADIKHVDNINARFCLIDCKQLAFMLTDSEVDASFDSGIWVNTGFFTSALRAMFDQVWDSHEIYIKN